MRDEHDRDSTRQISGTGVLSNLARFAACLVLFGSLSSCSLFDRGPEVFPALTRPSGLVVQDVVVPEGPEAVLGSTVTVGYHGTLENGEVFDSSRQSGQPIEFEIGSGMAPPALDEGVLGMRLFGRRRIWAPAPLVFPGGVPDWIDAEQRLAFDLELLAID